MFSPRLNLQGACLDPEWSFTEADSDHRVCTSIQPRSTTDDGAHPYLRGGTVGLHFWTEPTQSGIGIEFFSK